MAVGYREGVAILQIAFYTPAILIGLLLIHRHGFANGWYFLLMLSLLRLVGGVFELVAAIDASTTAYTGALVCSSIGLAPLTLLCLGLLSRVNDYSWQYIPKSVFRTIDIVSLTGLVIAIVGASIGDSATNPYHKQPEVKAAVVLFAAVFAATFAIFCILCLRLSTVRSGEKRLVLAVGLSLPFLLTRLLYSLIAVFSNLRRFSAIFGSVTIYLCLGVLQEIIVVIICIAVGLTLRVAPKHRSGMEQDDGAVRDAPALNPGAQMTEGVSDDGVKQEAQPMYGGVVAATNSQETTTPRPNRKFRGPVTWLIFKGKDYFENRSR
ncbi:MAG: hypothetical protein M1818_001380 [Claussenomyces sp. TS43310]|nr:MAG: hypothetical protein M1818_001380 [Claussenomyces sp. TS43310]